MKIFFSHTDIEKFIKSLQVETRAKVIRTFELLQKFGHELRMPHVKKIEDDLFELRVRGKESVRFFFFFHKRQIIVILHGFIKKSQKIPLTHIQKARNRKKKIINE